MIVLASGGLDSTTLAYLIARKQKPEKLVLLSIAYGQRHEKELESARRIAGCLDALHLVCDISDLAELLPSSALTNKALEVPAGEYTHDTLKVTVVPNRNVIFLSIAVAIAAAQGFEAVAIAAHAGDHPVYPDCRPEFVDAFNRMERKALAGIADVSVYAPFLYLDKAQIVALGARLGVPFEHTWSCYLGEELHCGRCSTCIERKRAFLSANVPDPTTYRYSEQEESHVS